MPYIASILDEVWIEHLFELHNSGKIDVPKSNTTLIWIHIFEWYVVRRGSTSDTKKTSAHKILDCLLRKC